MMKRSTLLFWPGWYLFFEFETNVCVRAKNIFLLDDDDYLPHYLENGCAEFIFLAKKLNKQTIHSTAVLPGKMKLVFPCPMLARQWLNQIQLVLASQWVR